MHVHKYVLVSFLFIIYIQQSHNHKNSENRLTYQVGRIESAREAEGSLVPCFGRTVGFFRSDFWIEM